MRFVVDVCVKWGGVVGLGLHGELTHLSVAHQQSSHLSNSVLSLSLSLNFSHPRIIQ